MFFIAAFSDIQDIPPENYLSAGEKMPFSESFPEKKENWLLGRYAAKKAVQNYFKEEYSQDLALKDILIKSDKQNGATFSTPFPDKEIGLHLSISHGGGYGAAAIEQVPVGVDIERVRTFKNDIRSAFLSPAEESFVDRASSDQKDTLATLFWSFKESYLKALKKGLMIHPQTVEILLSDDKERHFLGLRHDGHLVDMDGFWKRVNDQCFFTTVRIK